MAESIPETSGTNIAGDSAEPIPLADFLVTIPRLERRIVAISCESQGSYLKLALPPIILHCGNEICGGPRSFDPTKEGLLTTATDPKTHADHFVNYSCRNCQKTFKTYAIRISAKNIRERLFLVRKIGEVPEFGQPRPNQVRDVLDDEIEYFERGYRAETAGLGIGAFAYYRRFVESHKNKIIAEIRKVAVAQGAKTDVLASLDRALGIDSFDKAVDLVKDAIPDSLRYNGGHNPLTLIHRALSGGLHSDDDVECLELAKDIRMLLTDLAERTTQALKNNAELGKAVTRLMNKGAKPSH